VPAAAAGGEGVALGVEGVLRSCAFCHCSYSYLARMYAYRITLVSNRASPHAHTLYSSGVLFSFNTGFSGPAPAEPPVRTYAIQYDALQTHTHTRARTRHSRRRHRARRRRRHAARCCGIDGSSNGVKELGCFGCTAHARSH
jgi:hypothetical protein